jgi:hypothetical protein
MSSFFEDATLTMANQKTIWMDNLSKKLGAL